MAATHDENESEATVIRLPNMRAKGLNKSIEQDQEMVEFPVSHMIKGRVNQEEENLNRPPAIGVSVSGCGFLSAILVYMWYWT